MYKENLHEPFSVVHKTLDECPKTEHRHSFFELVFVLSGTGSQCINKSRFDYHAGHMFLITPEDCHSFEIASTTEFFFLRFNDIYVKDSGLKTDSIRRLEYILQNANHKPGCILKNLTDKNLVRPLVDAIIREKKNHQLYDKELIHQLVNTLIIVVARNIAMYLPDNLMQDIDERAREILQFIQSNIYDPDKLKAGNISRTFNISEAYLGKFFKKQTQETMQQYISNYKARLIEHRLQYSDKRINEIANEFGFTDESHLNKFLRKHKGRSPRDYRRHLRNLPHAQNITN